MKNLKFIIAVALLFAAAVPVMAENLLGIEGEEATSVGIYIKNLENGEVLIDSNSQLALTPASVMKVLTAATVLSVHGADERFETKVVLRGSGLRDGVWHGDLVVHGSADPTLESENFRSRRGLCDSIVAAVRRYGIREIDGCIVVDEKLRDAGPVLQWEAEDIAWPYGAGLYGFNYRDNVVTVYPNTGRITPEAPGMEMVVQESESGNDFVRGVYSDRLMVFRRNNKPDWAVKTAVQNPAAVFRAELMAGLGRAGISVGAAPASQVDDEETALYTQYSPVYADILKSMMIRSDNLFAEGMLRTLAPAGRRKDAIAREKELWASRGINTRYTIINDGSGLTRANRISARLLGDVLEWMAESPDADTFTGFFPRAGKEGTMRGMLAKSRLKGLVALKTGSISSVQCYAGYKIDEDSNPTHIIVVMVNGFFCKRADVRKATESMLESIFL